MGKTKIKFPKLPLRYIGDKIDHPLKLPYQKSQYFKLWCKANNLQKKIYKKITPPIAKRGHSFSITSKSRIR
jgi:hypothetical protein